MTVAQQRLTLADYLAYEAPTEKRDKLVSGELIEMLAKSDINQRIALLFPKVDLTAAQVLAG